MSDLDKPTSAGTGMRRSLKIVLFASLALNLAVAGVVIGAVAKHGFEDDRRAPRIEGPGGPLTRALSKEDRREIGRALREEFGAMRPTREAMQAQYAQVIAALKATPYDAETVRAVVAAQSAAMDARVRAGQEQLLNRLDDMSPDERAAFAGRLQEVLERTQQKRVEKSGGRRDGF
ncbi:periplasmic heavy metal sensor [Rhodalgimonas zhirmunskyi]|uniref:Periplasmic heavy metal sensor n=1 Tax=Rhodalgimonas zhirmunskyi TaxID=2964767 RepID=A0AAJ1UBY1_9RHOB|nr:periplasmic heavy metal sensor [Rhodoalgimonas zhirmunskyi]MDQ2095700.1 periplasmic heavy metal sensor [Rhodoalgimonas zhirmunskyi]